MYRALFLLLTISLTASCASTQKAWSDFKPSEYAYVVTNGKDPEPLLKESKVNYYCEDVAYTSDRLNKACYVEKTLAQQTDEFTRSLSNTPKALAEDMLVIGKVTVQAIAYILKHQHRH